MRRGTNWFSLCGRLLVALAKLHSLSSRVTSISPLWLPQAVSHASSFKSSPLTPYPYWCSFVNIVAVGFFLLVVEPGFNWKPSPPEIQHYLHSALEHEQISGVRVSKVRHEPTTICLGDGGMMRVTKVEQPLEPNIRNTIQHTGIVSLANWNTHQGPISALCCNSLPYLSTFAYMTLNHISQTHDIYQCFKNQYW